VEASRRCCALGIGLAVISEWELGHDEPWHACPGPLLFYSATRRVPTTMDRLASPIRARGEGESGTQFRSIGRPLGSIQQICLVQQLLLAPLDKKKSQKRASWSQKDLLIDELFTVREPCSGIHLSYTPSILFLLSPLTF
jgi:hypothetical protein